MNLQFCGLCSALAVFSLAARWHRRAAPLQVCSPVFLPGALTNLPHKGVSPIQDRSSDTLAPPPQDHPAVLEERLARLVKSG